jgi:hypothetical protein
MSALSPQIKMEFAKAHAAARQGVAAQLAGFGSDGIPGFLMGMAGATEGKLGNVDFNPMLRHWEETALAKANVIAREFRKNTRAKSFVDPTTMLAKSAIAKAALDVGNLTNLAQVTGGQTLGYVSLDTDMARGTVRPNSFTLYNALNKTMANQIVDFWPYASSTGGALPGASYASYASQTSGALTPNAGKYNLNYINLKLALDPRAITVALAQQNSFVNVAEQENVNAALAVLQSVDWACYHGNPTLYPNQPQGIAGVIPSRNIIDFRSYVTTYSSQGLSNEQYLFNLIYEQAAYITSYRQYGQITHAFMSPAAAGSMQSLVTGILNNIVNDISPYQRDARAIVPNGDLQGMRTRFGDIQFPIDLFITARDQPAQAIDDGDGSNPATTTNPTPPASVVASVLAAGQTGSDWDTTYAASGNKYVYAVASCDANMNESILAYSGVASGVAATGAVQLVITPPTDLTAAVFRVFRSGLGYAATSNQDPNAFRWIADVAANGGSAVTFVDLNAHIPGSDTLFLLDLDESDNALDYRTMLPLTKIELFAQNIYMPWAVGHIGSPRVRIPKYHGIIQNYVPTNPQWNPLNPNS